MNNMTYYIPMVIMDYIVLTVKRELLMTKIILIIPAYNEAQNIERLIQRITENYPEYDYIIVNDGSTDATYNICKQRKFNVLNLPVNLGIGGAVQAGYLYAKQNGYQIAVQIDGDGQHDVAYVKNVIEPILQGQADVVIGSRFIAKEGFQTSSSRRFGIRILSSFIWLCTGKRIYDVTSGFRAVNRNFINIYSVDYPRDYPEPEALVSAMVYGGKVKEVPVVMKERQGGTSSINLKRSIYYMVKVSLAIFIRRLSYGVRRSKGDKKK